MVMTMRRKKEEMNDIGCESKSADYLRSISDMAYYRAESRNFVPGHDLEDWYEAEKEYNQKEE
jgi:Protein of unknown function (DUF2934)